MGQEGDAVPWIRRSASGLSGANGKIGLMETTLTGTNTSFANYQELLGVLLEADNG